MVETNVFELAQIIKNAGADPGDITSAVWAASYRKPEKSAEEAALLTIDLLGEYHGNEIPGEHWPETYEAVLLGELNRVIQEAEWLETPTPASIAKEIINAGYSKVAT
ncbi:MAG: hypothetical protein ACTH8P_16690 [Ewingella sp.]|uniref:hypothetical protein n=1 Tax=Ewingella TaxID=41201 RepID=UPI0033658D7A